MVDIMGDVVKPGDPTLKTSLYSINKVVDAYGINFRAAKLHPKEVPKLETPFIASFSDEHFVIHEGKRYGLCCPMCEKSFKRDSAKYIAKMKEQEPELDCASTCMETIGPEGVMAHEHHVVV